MTSTLQVAPGSGQLRRRPTALLLTLTASDADATLGAAFDAADDPDVIDSVTAASQRADFVVGSYVVITWNQRIEMALFGDVALVSDHPSMRRLPAAGSQTWIERTIRLGDGERLVLTVEGTEPDPATDLRSGAVRAGGFQLTLDSLAVPATARDHVPAQPRRQPPPIDRAPAPETLRQVDAPVDDVLNLRAANTDPTRDFIDGIPGLEPNAIEPSGGPATWQLRFLDGRIEPVDRPLLLGRRPGHLDALTRPVVIDCSEASSEHVRIDVRLGGEPDTSSIWLTDLASRNRTWMVTSGDQQLVSLEPHQATQLLAGTHVQVGSVVFVVELVPH